MPNTVSSSGQVDVTATAQDNVGVREVRFYVNDELRTTDTTAPYAAKLTLGMGVSTIKAVAVDTSGNESAPATQTVTVGGADSEIPNLEVTGPTAVRTTSPVDFSIVASDNVGVTSVTVYEGDRLLETFTQFPTKLTRSFTSADNGTHTYRFVVRDAAGNSRENRFSFEVNISNGPVDTVRPVVTLGDIPAVITAAGIYPISFNATDNVGVVKVELQVIARTASGDTTYAKTFTTTSDKFDLPITREANGKYDVVVVAYDAAGNTGRVQKSFTVAIP